VDVRAPDLGSRESQTLVANQDEAVTFFSGGSRSFTNIIDSFHGVFILEVDLDTMNRRIDERLALDPTDFWRNTRGTGSRCALTSYE
jgi:hypothetical protein